MNCISYDNKFFFTKENVGSKRKMLRFFGVRRHSYAGEVIVRLYDGLFGNAINVYKEYKRFYAGEFTDYVTYLICHFSFSKELAEEISSNRVYYKDYDFQSKGPAGSFKYEDELKDYFYKCIGGIRYETSGRIRY